MNQQTPQAESSDTIESANERISTLFQLFALKGLRFRNRIVVPPMVQGRPIGSDACLTWYERLAAGGSSLVIVESTPVRRLRVRAYCQSLGKIVRAIHINHALAGIQLFPIDFGQKLSPTDVSEQQILSIIKEYHRAADTCANLGFDVIEAHGAHGYFLNQFLSRVHNKRKDIFGIQTGRTGRFATEIVDAMSRGFKNSGLVMYRHSPVGDGYTTDDSVTFCSNLKQAGADIIDVSPSTLVEPADLAAAIRENCVMPVIAVGRFNDPLQINMLLSLVRCDLVAIGRQMIADPFWPLKVKEKRNSEIVVCDYCDKTCSIRRNPIAYCYKATDAHGDDGNGSEVFGHC